VNLPGPLAAARLHALGAAITKIEPPEGDPLAAACPAWYARCTPGRPSNA
jgi:crotonobetainyl-CoA:carnitine CoA-transferase CaiB-like acyl-CoA transferase